MRKPSDIYTNRISIRCCGKIHDISLTPKGQLYFSGHSKEEILAWKTLNTLGYVPDVPCAYVLAYVLVKEDILYSTTTHTGSRVNSRYYQGLAHKLFRKYVFERYKGKYYPSGNIPLAMKMKKYSRRPLLDCHYGHYVPTRDMRPQIINSLSAGPYPEHNWYPVGNFILDRVLKSARYKFSGRRTNVERISIVTRPFVNVEYMGIDCVVRFVNHLIFRAMSRTIIYLHFNYKWLIDVYKMCGGLLGDKIIHAIKPIGDDKAIAIVYDNKSKRPYVVDYRFALVELIPRSRFSYRKNDVRLIRWLSRKNGEALWKG